MRKSYPLIEKAEGVYIFDSKGRKYIDGVGGIGVVNIGHRVREIREAMVEQAKKVCFIYNGQFITEPAINLAKKIVELTPPKLSKVFLVSGGSEAVETALKMARQYHVETGHPSKYRVIARWTSYHGNTIGALSMSGRPSWRKNFIPLLLNFPHISPPYCYRCPFEKEYPHCGVDCAYDLERVVNLEGPESISAFIAEPIIGTTAPGVTPPPEYYKIIREICNKYNVLMIVDEVITGFGRTGKNFGINHWDVTPDIIITGKGISSGYAPLAAVITHERIYEAFARGSESFTHGYTYVEHPLSCAIGLAVQQYIEKNNLIERSSRIGSLMLEKLSRLKELPIVGDIRGKGLLLGVELVRDKENKAPFERELQVQEKIVDRCFEKGLVLVPGIPGNVDGISGDQIQITPPYIIDKIIIDKIVEILEESITEVQNKLSLE
jgi:adenosylmethionine-8-amino-7-oxononanoate aminotransferase